MSPSPRFITTRWSLVLAARDVATPDGRSALATLCELYWFPVYAFIRRSGRDAEDAKDLTQAFFTKVLEKDYFKSARQERGRFRSFLFTAVRSFLANESDAERALKRGGGRTHLPLEFDDGERRYSREPADGLTPEHLYEQRWAQTVLHRATVDLAAKYQGDARSALFARLKPLLTDDGRESYSELARDLKMTEGALRVAVHRLRQHFGVCLREVIAETVQRPEDVEEELRHLMTVVSR